MAKMYYSPSQIMEQWDYIREHGQNQGREIEAIQHWAGGQKGDSYCCESLTVSAAIAFKGASDRPIPFATACQTIYELCKAKNMMIEQENADIDDIFFYVIPETDHAHHIGWVTKKGATEGIAGNTSADGKSDNGDGFHKHALSMDKNKVKYARFPRE